MGKTCMGEPHILVAQRLGVPGELIFANSILFDDHGRYPFPSFLTGCVLNLLNFTRSKIRPPARPPALVPPAAGQWFRPPARPPARHWLHIWVCLHWFVTLVAYLGCIFILFFLVSYFGCIFRLHLLGCCCSSIFCIFSPS